MERGKVGKIVQPVQGVHGRLLKWSPEASGSYASRLYC